MRIDSPLKIFGVYPPALYERHQVLFAALSELEPVEFCAISDLKDTTIDALVLCEASTAYLATLPPGLPPVIAYTGGISIEGSNCEHRSTIRFSSSSVLSKILRGQVFTSVAGKTGIKSLPAGSVPLATQDSEPIWAKVALLDAKIDVVSGRLPNIHEQQPYLFSAYQSGNFMALLPLLHFVREQLRPAGFITGGLRACFMFDDPNLHASSFGFIDYPSLADSAKRHNYHVSFATIPLDGWYIDQKAARLFKENSNWLSFLIHGNNHVSEELARNYPGPRRIALAAQALRRIEAVERKAGIPISRIMAAPHGACSEKMAEALQQTGYSAACISRGSLMHYNPGRTWPTHVGMGPAEFVGEGFPVIPRIRMAVETKPQIILSAFLEHPLIFVGHHQDVKHGYGLLEELAQFINNLAPTSWSAMDSIAESNYRVYQQDRLADVTMYSRHIRLVVPIGVNRIRIRRPWLAGEARALLEIVSNSANDSEIEGKVSRPKPVTEGSAIEIISPVDGQINFRSVNAPPFHIWGLARRLITEARDRSLAMIHDNVNFYKTHD